MHGQTGRGLEPGAKVRIADGRDPAQCLERKARFDMCLDEIKHPLQLRIGQPDFPDGRCVIEAQQARRYRDADAVGVKRPAWGPTS